MSFLFEKHAEDKYLSIGTVNSSSFLLFHTMFRKVSDHKQPPFTVKASIRGKALVLWYLPCSTIGDSRETRFSQKAKRLRCTVAGNSPSRCCRRERVEAVGELMGNNEGYVCD